MAVPEIRSIVFANLDRQSLVIAGRVCRDWAATVVDFTWRELNSDKLSSFSTPPKQRRSLYCSAVRTLFIPKPLSLPALKAWTFPRLRRLHCHDSLITQPSAVKSLRGLLSRCGTPTATLLSEVILTSDLSKAIGPPPDQEPLYTPFTERYIAGFGKYDGGTAKLHTPALQLLAEHDKSARTRGDGGYSVLEIHRAVVTSAALQQVFGAVPDAFANVRRLSIVIQGDDWAQVQPLLCSQIIDDLELGVIEKGDALRIINDVSCQMRQLRRLAIGFAFSVESASWTSLLVLGQLSHLEELSLYGELLPIRLSAEDWRHLLSQLPRLQRLAVGAECELPYDAYIIAGECCRQLRHLDFDNVNDHGALVRHAPEPRIFPEMRTMTLSSFGACDFRLE